MSEITCKLGFNAAAIFEKKVVNFCKKKVSEKIACIDYEEKMPYSCKFCGEGFKDKRRVIRHVDTVHERKKTFSCSILGKC